jgi:CDP-glycerol glycerophosphotransferase (TagB/SpsB family)
MIASKKYNMFDLFLFTSQHEADVAKSLGIKSAIAGGYPKLDAFRQKETIAFSKQLVQKPFFRREKKTLLFTATWAQSGMSAVDKWVDQLPLLIKDYNIMVSLHPMMDKSYEEKVKNIHHIFYAKPEELPACMLAADFLVSDTSSVIAEFCALNKPIITFKVTAGHRLTPEIKAMIRDVSLQIVSLDELAEAIKGYEGNNDLKKPERMYWNRLFYDNPDAIQGRRAASIINDKLKYY